MNRGIQAFLSLEELDRRDVFEAAAARLDTLPSYVEKDFWVCLILDVLYNQLPDGHPRLLFKGGTSLSKAFDLIRRFSEDIDLVVYRDGLGFEGERDPTIAGNLSNKKRSALFKKLKEACSNYILGDLKEELAGQIGQMAEGCDVGPDEDDLDRQTLWIEYPTLYPSADLAYVAPRVRIEAGARSALDPSLTCSVIPLVADELQGYRRVQIDAQFRLQQAAQRQASFRVSAPDVTIPDRVHRMQRPPKSYHRPIGKRKPRKLPCCPSPSARQPAFHVEEVP